MIHEPRLIKVGFWAPIDPAERIADGVARVFFGLTPYPEANLHINPTWPADERKTVLAYLAKGKRMPNGEFGFSTCRLCGIHNGSAEFTDGVYVWPEGFAHYLREHGVKPPDERFIQYATRRVP